MLGGVLFGSSFNDIYSSGAAFEKVTNAKIVHLAPILNTSPDELVLKLRKVGVTTVSTDLSLNEIAKTNNLEVHDIIEPLFK